jgi:hypothetical protein
MESNWADFKTIERAVTIQQVLEHYGVRRRGSGKELHGPGRDDFSRDRAACGS